MSKNWIKVIGLVASLVGFGATMLTSWVNEKNTDAMIEEKLEKALAERTEENENNANENES